MRQCPYKLWRPITFEPITYLIVSIHHSIRFIGLSKNNYVAKLKSNWFKSYESPKFIGTLSDIPHIYVNYFVLTMLDSCLRSSKSCFPDLSPSFFAFFPFVK